MTGVVGGEGRDEFGACRGLIRLQGKLRRKDKSLMKEFLHSCVPSGMSWAKGTDSPSNHRDRHSNAIITTFTICGALNILYLYSRPGLGLSLHTFVVMCCITEQTKLLGSQKQPCQRTNTSKSIKF